MFVERRTQRFLDALRVAGGPKIHELTPGEARRVWAATQAVEVSKLPADIDDRTIPGGPTGTVSLRILRPRDRTHPLPALMYFHGGGWVVGDRDTHDRLIRELANGADVAVVFVDFTRAPEAQYPVAIEQAYSATRWVAEMGREIDLDPTRIAVAGDDAGGNLAAAVTLLAKERRAPQIVAQLLFYPVTDADFDTGSYHQFANDVWLTRETMKWCWSRYLPDESARARPTASPLRGSLDQLDGLPPALVISAENDVLRDEGEAYAQKLGMAGVEVTAVSYLGTIHDFLLLNPIAATPAPRAAIAQACEFLRRVLGTGVADPRQAPALVSARR
jgi:acetyl esterase